jgi:hypothetical protein
MAADFVLTTTTKSAQRLLAEPIASRAAFDALIAGVIEDNPWECTAYEVAGVAKDPITRGTEAYTAVITYEDGNQKVVGRATLRAPTIAGIGTAITNTLANSALSTAMGGTAHHDEADDTYSCTLKAHWENGELFNVSFKRSSLTISSYTDDVIATDLDTWADGITALA